MIKEKMRFLLEHGYVDVSDTPLWPNLLRAVKGLNEGGVVRAGDLVIGNERFCLEIADKMLDRLTLDKSGTTENSVVNLMNSDEFIDTKKSSNYILDKCLKTNGKKAAVIVTNPVELKTGHFAVLKTEDSGDVKYEISVDGGVAFDRIYPNKGNFVYREGNSAVLKILIAPGAKVMKYGVLFK